MKTEAQAKEILTNLVGKVVEFTPKIDEVEFYFEENMRARIATK